MPPLLLHNYSALVASSVSPVAAHYGLQAVGGALLT
jgi:hypothetical protein